MKLKENLNLNNLHTNLFLSEHLSAEELSAHYSCLLLINLDTLTYVAAPTCKLSEPPSVEYFLNLWKSVDNNITPRKSKSVLQYAKALIGTKSYLVFMAKYKSNKTLYISILLKADEIKKNKNKALDAECMSIKTESNSKLYSNLDAALSRLQDDFKLAKLNNHLIHIIYFTIHNLDQLYRTVNEMEFIDFKYSFIELIRNASNDRGLKFWIGKQTYYKFFLVCESTDATYIKSTFEIIDQHLQSLDILQSNDFLSIETTYDQFDAQHTNIDEIIDKLRSSNNNSSPHISEKKLTIRESEILKLILLGHTNEQIGKIKFITLPTVKKHISSILKKYQVSSKNELLSLYLNNNKKQQLH